MKIITINLYSVTGEHLIPMLQLGCHQSLELGFMETDEGDLYLITLKIYLYWGNPKPEDIILNYIRNRLIPSLKEVIWRTNGDDSYYDYTPDYTNSYTLPMRQNYFLPRNFSKSKEKSKTNWITYMEKIHLVILNITQINTGNLLTSAH